MIIKESQFRPTDWATVSAAEVNANKETILDALRKGLSEIDIFSFSRSLLQAFSCLVSCQRAIADIRSLIKSSRNGTQMYVIRTYD